MLMRIDVEFAGELFLFLTTLAMTVIGVWHITWRIWTYFW